MHAMMLNMPVKPDSSAHGQRFSCCNVYEGVSQEEQETMQLVDE